MYPVTKAFRKAITDPKNRKVFGKLIIDYTNATLDESINVEVNDRANISYPEQVTDGVNIPIGKILSLDGSWKLDDSFKFAPSPNSIKIKQMGWWGNELSNSNGIFNINPKLTTTFTPRAIEKIVVVGDEFRNEYPVDFDVKLYDINGGLLHEESILDNNVIFYEKKLYNIVSEVTRIDLEIKKWNKPNRQVKILEFYTSIREIYFNEEIMEMNLIEQRADSSTGLPIGNVANNELSIKLSNEDGRFTTGNTQSPLNGLLLPNRRVTGYLGVSGNISRWTDILVTRWDEIKELEE